ncbi:efflux transporter outer membrane subunit [Bordetella genomosp. 12]|uniref:ABC transporter permease n=1 Tax=Bordetella genomosp. 12 TaxID=463035 RepID=A0A261VLN8_9BORD|nr:efflux transporter outer membrane subunit [Bordetella genomosp. 12]OZI75034.1 ABC transporter permease [Bordetella genomosp. 12]
MPHYAKIATRLPWLLLLLAGCAVGPDFQRPAPDGTPLAAPAQVGQGSEMQRLQPGADVPAQWWRLFESPVLDGLVRQALADSPTLAQARAKLTQAREAANAEAGSRLLPAVDAKLSGVRQRVDPSSMGIDMPQPDPFALYNASIAVSYTLDIWGAERRAVEASLAEAERMAYEWQAARMTLAANVVTTAIRQAGQREALQAASALAEAQQAQLQIVRKRLDAGAVAEREWRAQAALVAQTQAQLPALRQELARSTHQLAVYLGQDPGNMPDTGLTLASLKLPADIPVSLPSALARQRPDILAAEAAWHHAAAEVGVATANLYPRLTLTAGFGSQRTHTNDLSNGINIWNIGLGLAQPLFRGGELRARKRGAQAAYEAAAAAYRDTVLQGWQQVADSLRALEHDAETLTQQRQAEAQTEAVYTIASGQYRVGGISQLNLLDAQRQLFAARRDRIQAQTDRYTDTAALMHALGGGWWNEAPPEPGV